jgi:hypothetical protein
VTTVPPPEIPGLVYVQPLGSGGYADVFLYEQQMPRMPVAVKVLKGAGLTPALRRQFTDEADTMAQLGDHPYIVQVFRADTSSDGRPYLVMKYYPPPNLAIRCRRERFTVEDVLRTGIQLASAVETAHRAGITHRDIKPANVLVSQYGAPGLTDFGIAGQMAQRAAPEDDSDDVGVSVPWAPPEVLFGQTNGDARADVYSLAATLWQLLVGRSPFEVPGGDNTAYALMPRIRSVPAPSTGRADVPVSLERLLAQAMAKDAAARPATALAFARALQEIEQEQRFTRTAIVVLDEQGHTALAEPAATPAVDDDDRTRIRSPRTVHAQDQGPTAAAPALTPGHLPLAESTAADDLAEAGTVQVDRSRARAATEAGAGPAHRADEEDVRRAVDRSAEGAEPLAPGRVAPTVLVSALGAVVVVLAGVAGWALLGRAGEAAPRPTATPSVVAEPTGDAVLSMPQTPTLQARAAAGAVHFSWTYTGREKQDTYRLRTGPSAAALPDAAWTVEKETSKAVPGAKGSQICAQAMVLRDGVSSPWSTAVCERTG